MNKTAFLLLGIIGALNLLAAEYHPAEIKFDTPFETDRGSMILGDGELGALAWVSSDGTLHTVLQRTDSWTEVGQHVKVGQLDYVTGCKVDEGTFSQVFSLERAEFTAKWLSDGKAVSLAYRIQHGTLPFAVCTVEGAAAPEAKIINWRLYEGGVLHASAHAFDIRFTGYGSDVPFDVNADVILKDLPEGMIGWCHLNRNETVEKLISCYDMWQGTAGIERPDILSHRAFGAIVKTQRAGEQTFFLTSVNGLQPVSSLADWQAQTLKQLNESGWDLAGESAARERHIAGWREFWNRSHVSYSPSSKAVPHKFELPRLKDKPVKIGEDQNGGNKFVGKWDEEPSCKIDEQGGLEIRAVFTLPDAKVNQRLVDNITPGKTDGFLVDVYGGKVRMIVGRDTITGSEMLLNGVKNTVLATVTPAGEATLNVNGKGITRVLEGASVKSARECEAVNLAWAAQRYVTACAGKGRLPIRFNGSLFTTREHDNPDFRLWGNGYWWQNTRLPYYAMYQAGDLECLQPLFRMYFDMLGYCRDRTGRHLKHDGAYFSECHQPWGNHFVRDWGTEPFEKRKLMLQNSTCHRFEWVGMMEISLMMLDDFAFRGDQEEFETRAVPMIREYVKFFREHYQVGDDGKLLMYPAQALETWQDCTAAMPEVAGLICVCKRMLALPEGLLSEDDVKFYREVQSVLPPLPERTLEDGRKVFAPAAKFGKKTNLELAELYCVFPFRLVSFEKDNAEEGRLTFEVRLDKHYKGWNQDELFGCYLGLAEDVRVHIVNRAMRNSSRDFRWPAYWGPNYDWRPDQCAGGNIQNTLQQMTMQSDGDKIFLKPALPEAWNVDFKLHAPKNTTVEGRIVDGKVLDLVVTPSSRAKDIVVVE